MKNKTIITVKELVTLAVIVAILEISKTVLAAIPNVEVVSLFIILFTIYLGGKVLFATIAFSVLEIFLWGFGMWNVIYFYIWPMLVLITLIFRKSKNRITFSIISGIYGLVFGAMSAIPSLVIGGLAFAISYWVSGIPFDIVHGVSNFIICFVLFNPLCKLFDRLRL